MNRWSVVAIHVVLWLVYVMLYALIWRPSVMSLSESVIREIFLLPFKMLLVYTCIGYLVPHVLQQKRYLGFAAAMIILITSSTILHNLYLHYVVPEKFAVLQPNERLFDWERISRRMTYLTSPMLFAFTTSMVVHWFVQKEHNNRITQENLRANLHLLKQQLQPHFVFNTLNSVYSLALQKSEQTPEVILKLSELMRYLSDQNGSDWVNLKDEITFISNYLSLEEMRYNERVKIEMSSDIDFPEKILIPPLVLTAFVENAFKHGVLDNAQASSIKVRITEDKNYLYYEVVNTRPEFSKPRTGRGTGLHNLRSRLAIIYGNNFVMTSGQDGECYIAQLQLMKKYEAA